MNFRTERGVKDTGPRRIAVYGPPGIGKTTFATGCPGALVLDLEDGARYIDVPRNVEPIETFDRFLEWLDYLANGDHEHRAVVIDTVDKLESLIHRHLIDLEGVTSIEDVRKGYGKGYIAAGEKMREVFGRLDVLRRKRGMEAILIAHAKVEKAPNPAGPEFLSWTMKTHREIAGTVFQLCDVVLFAAQSMVVRREKRLYGDDKYRAIGDGARLLHTVGTPSFFAKNRCNLPAEINLSWDSFEVAYAAGRKPSAVTDSIRARLDGLSEEFRASAAGAKLCADVRAAIERVGTDTPKLLALSSWMEARLHKLDEETLTTQQEG